MVKDFQREITLCDLAHSRNCFSFKQPCPLPPGCKFCLGFFPISIPFGSAISWGASLVWVFLITIRFCVCYLLGSKFNLRFFSLASVFVSVIFWGCKFGLGCLGGLNLALERFITVFKTKINARGIINVIDLFRGVMRSIKLTISNSQ